jgi:alpha-beta hydrolase superfamily lysophospholipase
MLTAILVASALAIAPRAALASTPEEYGPYAVRETPVEIPVPVDPSGPEGIFTSLNADVYIPAAPGPWPLVQISHAWPGTLREFPLSGWAERLASRGFVVIVSDRRGASSELSTWPTLDPASDVFDLSASVNGEDILRILRWAIAQNETSDSFLYGAVDPRRIAIAGHSLGGYLATFAAMRSQVEGPQLSALVLLDPADERLGQLTYESSLLVAPSLRLPTADLASEENQHPIQCNMEDGSDCTLVAPQEYAALTGVSARLGVRAIGSVHEDVEDPKTTADSPVFLQMFERYGMAWIEYWLTGDCTAAAYLGGAARPDILAHRIALYPGRTRVRQCAT